MRASLTIPASATLISGDNPVYLGNVTHGESRNVNWTLVFTAGGVFILDVNASGYNQLTGVYVEEHGNATATVKTVRILSPKNTTYNTHDVLLTFNVVEPVDWMGYSLDGQANETITGNTTLTSLFDGPHCVEVFANDTSGNMGSDKVCFAVDTTAPVVSILPPQNITYSTNNVLLSLTVEEPVDWMGYSLDGQANETITGNKTLTGLPDGVHYVVAYANDSAGNMGRSGRVCFTVDTLPPNITDVSQFPLENNVLSKDEVEINATVTDLSVIKWVTLRYTNGNGTWMNVEMFHLEGNIWNATIPAFPYGTNVTYIVTAEDIANNTLTTPDGYQYQYHVISEYPTSLITTLFVVATLVAAVTAVLALIYRKKHSPSLEQKPTSSTDSPLSQYQ